MRPIIWRRKYTPTWWHHRLTTSVIAGLLFLLLTLIPTASAKPIAIPIGKVGGEELNAVLPSATILMMILAGNLIQIVWSLWNSIQKSKDKKNDQTATKLDQLHTLVNRMEERLEAMDERIREIRPNIRLHVLETMREFDRK